MNERAIVIDPNTNEIYEAGECGLPKEGGDFLAWRGWVEKACFDFQTDVHPILTPLPQDSMWRTVFSVGQGVLLELAKHPGRRLRAPHEGGAIGSRGHHVAVYTVKEPPEKDPLQVLDELVAVVDEYDWNKKTQCIEKIAEAKRYLADRKGAK